MVLEGRTVDDIHFEAGDLTLNIDGMVAEQFVLLPHNKVVSSIP